MKIQQSIDAIENSISEGELDDHLKSAANDIGCRLFDCYTYKQSREWFDQDNANGDKRMVQLLDAAIATMARYGRV